MGPLEDLSLLNGRLPARAMGLVKEWVKRFPFREMVRRGWLEDARSVPDRAHALLEFFGVASPEQWDAVYERHAVAFRKSAAFEANPTDSWRLPHGRLTHRRRSRTLQRALVCLLGSSSADSSTMDTCPIPTATISS
ncbi:MAG: hypothetical protein BMS9Abin29_2493 [Gemmatimonadota bacterium]|nr:MAG: hypothetical protein BMS9Abin29_2493 [Gemmatimonadota bacterium]